MPGPLLSQRLGRHDTEGEARIHDVSRQIVGGSHASPEDLPEADLLCVANALIEVLEGLAVVEIRGMNRVASLAEFVSEPEEALRLSLRVMKSSTVVMVTHCPVQAALKRSGGTFHARLGAA